MQFTSLLFIAFLAAVAVGCFVLPKSWRRPFLLLASLAFYFYGAPRYGVFLLCAIAITYGCARWLAACKTPRGQKGVLALGVLGTLAFLLFFKYYNFAAENVGALLGMLGAQNPLPMLNIALPVGISFYTFQSLGYLLDVYRGQTAPEKNILTYALFVAFFPQVQSGPISRSTTLLPQLQSRPPAFEAGRAKYALAMMLWGFFKKLVVADRLAVPVAAIFENWQTGSGTVLLAGTVLFAAQLYCDFSGYSAIAIGCAKLLGYNLDPNFAFPYHAASIAEFWRRWHISLSGWFRDYVFYPLLRSRPLMALAKALRGKVPVYYAKNIPVAAALVVLWLATGLWHGAAWNYAAFGLWHGGLIILATLLAPAFDKAGVALRLPRKSKGWHLFCVARTFVLVCAGFVFFRAPGLSAAFGIFGRIFTAQAPSQLWDGTMLTLGLSGPEWAAGLAAAALVFLAEWLLSKKDLYAALQSRPLPLRWAVYLGGLMLVVIFGMYGEGYVEKPFVYFQF